MSWKAHVASWILPYSKVWPEVIVIIAWQHEHLTTSWCVAIHSLVQSQWPKHNANLHAKSGLIWWWVGKSNCKKPLKPVRYKLTLLNKLFQPSRMEIHRISVFSCISVACVLRQDLLPSNRDNCYWYSFRELLAWFPLAWTNITAVLTKDHFAT